MQFPIIAGAVVARNALTTVALTGNTNGITVDTSDLEGNLLAVLNSAAASASDTLDVTLEESSDGSSWSAVPADAIFNPTTGAVTTFSQVTAAAASYQQVGIVKERLKRYVRMVFTVGGSSISIPASGSFIGALKYS
jgi:hypothetical protein